MNWFTCLTGFTESSYNDTRAQLEVDGPSFGPRPTAAATASAPSRWPLAGVLNARRGASNIVLPTLLGGGAFGNDETWILEAIRRAMAKVAGFDLDVRVVSYGASPDSLRQLARDR